jgi:uncharacterized coiled-coil protein SlyX/uncharacterized protein YukE
MARVVQRRTPPYLLISFVVLFVVATVMAVLFYNKFADAQLRYLARDAEKNQLASPEQLSSGDIRQMIAEYQKQPAGTRQTVVAQLGAQIGTLAYAVTGLTNSTFAEAQQDIDKTIKAIKPAVPRSLTKHMVDFNDQLGVKDADIARLKADKAQLEEKDKAVLKELADAKTDFEAKLKQKDQQLASLDQKFQNFESDHNQKLEDAKKEFLQAREELTKQKAEQADAIDQLNKKVAVVEKKLELEREKKVRGVLSTGSTARRPDGKIKQVVGDQGLVYIDIGSKDRVTEDLRFTVYPITGIPDSGAGKGVIEVTNVSDGVSECRIVEQKKDDPIVAGDLIANVVFSSLRSYNFVVEGQFDVDAAGAATPAGTKAIKDLVRRYGGQIANDVSLDTDYVILGDQPPRPRKPEDTAPQEEWDRYQELMKAFTRYQDVKKAAEGMQIPRLGGKRFLDLVGYIPTKVAKAE